MPVAPGILVGTGTFGFMNVQPTIPITTIARMITIAATAGLTDFCGVFANVFHLLSLKTISESNGTIRTRPVRTRQIHLAERIITVKIRP